MRENKQGESPLVALVSTVAFLGLEARAVEVQVQVMPGLPNFVVVGLADKAPKAASVCGARCRRSDWRCRPSGL